MSLEDICRAQEISPPGRDRGSGPRVALGVRPEDLGELVLHAGVQHSDQERRCEAVIRRHEVPADGERLVQQQPGFFQTSVARKEARPDLSAKLSGERLGVLRQATYGEFALALYPEARIQPYDSLARAGADLAAGRIDLLLGEEAALRHDLLETPTGSGLVFFGPDIPAPMPVEAEAAIAVRGEDVPLREALERAIGAIRADGTYARISQRYFHADVYGG